MYEFIVPDISCGGCAKTITRILGELDAAAKVEIDVATKQVKVETALAREAIVSRLTEAGFEPQA
ncbi:MULTISPECIES: heavy-metal-associated domain-containing protein [Uliginosibacterium]|uniref:Heavy-metal-associated domain-containing protein n=1 Tax=Uliginosibacterium aquaticum TaxID=2731212 RepID=A0ABX2ICK9_9RHOO|nr:MULTISPECIES: heavy-metal-associated domain-containing protein [Uliginosibacterium]MDO6385846.1 heavy-metal-associated domain-containing protein [Uliginosibacterium sp. 31-12]NSL54239.1 heavy-metal-associated domain-containing protein [Uliginosibacterium aquaticum]